LQEFLLCVFSDVSDVLLQSEIVVMGKQESLRSCAHEILEIRINIKFWKSKLGLEIKCNAQWIQIKYKTYICIIQT